MKKINDKKKLELLERARSVKENGGRLTDLFKAFADENGRAAGSIRNFYYRTIAQDGGCGLVAKKNEYFTESAENELIALLLRERAACGSLRKAAFLAAEGDPILALRYQNKYYSMLKKQREKIMSRTFPPKDSDDFSLLKKQGEGGAKKYFSSKAAKKRKRDEVENW